MCVPVQRLYLKEGQRYDLGAGTYVSAGTFFAAIWSLPADRAVALRVAGVLFAALLIVFAVRVLALTFGRPADFTLVSFGQLWATPALIDYELQTVTKASGVPLEPIAFHPLILASAASAAAAVLGYAIYRTSLPDRLVALTEAPNQYRLLFGSPGWLALRLELMALTSFFFAGVLLRLTINDLSPATFGTEGIWCVLAAAAAARSAGPFLLAGPLATTVVRFLIKSIVPSRFSSMAVYGALVLVLVLVISRSKEASRDAIA